MLKALGRDTRVAGHPTEVPPAGTDRGRMTVSDPLLMAEAEHAGLRPLFSSVADSASEAAG